MGAVGEPALPVGMRDPDQIVVLLAGQILAMQVALERLLDMEVG
jgi:hypothetical protein